VERLRLAREREDHRAGLVAAMIANVYRKPGTAPIQPGDFFRRRQERPQTWQQQLRVVRMLATVFGGEVTTGGR
jgi:hypothetical protein